MKYLKKVESLPTTLEEGVLYYDSTEDKVAIKPTPKTPEMVDLGLSVKWAKWNVGATNETEGGKYFMFGDVEGELVEGKTTTRKYIWANAPYYSGSSQTSYRTDAYPPATTLAEKDDAATVVYGSGYRMPTEAELIELTTNTTSAFTTVNGVSGLKLTSKKKGYTDKYVFFPAVGYCGSNSVSNLGSRGYVWSSNILSSLPYSVYYFGFDKSYMGVNGGLRCNGYSVRAVCE